MDTEALGSLLERFHREYPEPGYVQGMNFLMASFLFHSGEDLDLAYDAFLTLMLKYGFAQIYD